MFITSRRILAIITRKSITRNNTDNFAEIVAPVVVLGTVLYEMAFRSAFGKGRAGVSSSVLFDLQDKVTLEFTTIALVTLIVLRIGVTKLECVFGNWLEDKVMWCHRV